MLSEDDVIRIDKFEVGGFGNNCYVVSDPASGQAVVVDAPFEADVIAAHTDGLDVTRIVVTHGHGDHVHALADLKAALPGVPAGCHAADQAMMPVAPDFLIADGDELPLGATTLRALHTPGHTPGGICLLTPGHLFSGDTLFPGGPGKTDLPGGDFDTVIASIRDRLFVLPDGTAVHPGHGLDTTIGAERPHLAEWVARGW